MTSPTLNAAVIGEKVTGRGILAQVGLETGIPIGQQSIFLLAFIGFFLFAAILGAMLFQSPPNKPTSGIKSLYCQYYESRKNIAFCINSQMHHADFRCTIVSGEEERA